MRIYNPNNRNKIHVAVFEIGKYHLSKDENNERIASVDVAYLADWPGYENTKFGISFEEWQTDKEIIDININDDKMTVLYRFNADVIIPKKFKDIVEEDDEPEEPGQPEDIPVFINSTECESKGYDPDSWRK